MRTLTFNRIIGNGAMGTVYHAELRVPRGFSRQCAVKVMKSTSPDQEHFRARMRDEARLLGMLQDEQILGVSELVRVEGRDCVVMEYVEGVDLADLIQVRTVPPRALAELGAEVAGTVHRAHEARHPTTKEPLHVIHRDVKPANVMITSRGGVRLLDFGVARAAFSNRESKTQGLVLGTLNYFPPEILAGGEPSPAVDIYGLGLTLWECATGRDWGSPQVHRHRFERRVEQRLAEISEDYAAIVPILRQVLQWDPAKRPDGGSVESALLAAADNCTGEGLRTWARQIVPPILTKRQEEARRDDLVGKTLSIEGAGGHEGPQSLDQVVPVSPGADRIEAHTFNDLAPPAAVHRERESQRSDARSARRDSRDDDLDEGDLSFTGGHPAETLRRDELPREVFRPKPPPPPADEGGMGRILLFVVAAMIVGGAIGLTLFVVIVGVAWLVLF
jgi:serine/threonine protein kinase